MNHHLAWKTGREESSIRGSQASFRVTIEPHTENLAIGSHKIECLLIVLSKHCYITSN